MKPIFTLTKKALSILFGGKVRTIAKDAELFEPITDALKRGDNDTVVKLMDIKADIVTVSEGKVTLRDGDLFYGDEPIHGTVVARVLGMYRDGKDGVAPLLRFVDKLMQNPSKRAVDELYGFLEACNLPITDDGCFLAYKMVNADFTDIYTGKMDNSPGQTPSMPRNKVDDNKERTCSDGLHFASRHYVESGGYGSRASGNRLLVLKIDPANVVSIPIDYNNSKGRACEYTVVEEIPWETEIKPHYAPTSGFDDVGNWEDEPEDEPEDEENEDEAPTTAHPVLPALFGESNPAAVLTEQKVRDIRNMLRDDWTLTAIANVTGVHRRTIARIRDGESWTHVV